MNSGIYKLTITRPDGSELFYYGQSQDLQKRMRQHVNTARAKTHRNPRIQNAFDKYGGMTFEVVCRAPVDRLDWLEQKFLDRYWGTAGCLNIAGDAHCPRRGVCHNEATKQLIRENRFQPDVRKPVCVTGPDGVQYFASAIECCKHYDIPRSTLSNWLIGRSAQPKNSPYLKYKHLRDLDFTYA